jgi:tetratricopeptide (TPR) repeat protein
LIPVLFGACSRSPRHGSWIHCLAGWVLLSTLLTFARSGSCAENWRDDPDTIAARAASGAPAVEAYQKLAARYPQVGQIQAELGEVLFDAKQYAEAAQAYTRAEQLGWKPDVVHVRIAKCYDRLHRHTDAEAEYRKALTAAPDSVAAQFGLAAALFNEEKSAAAIPYLEKLVSRKDDWGAFAQEYLAQAYFDVKNFDASMKLARKLAADNPSDLRYSWLLARNLYKTRHFEEALALFRKHEATDPKRAQVAKYYAAVCLENLGRTREAETEYSAAARTDHSSEFGREASVAERRLAGNPYRFVLDYLGGYDTGVILNDANGTPTKKKDGFNQTFLDVEGRVAHTKSLDLWLGAEHYSLLYPKLHDNNYVSNAAKTVLEVPEVGPFKRVIVQYALRYSELDDRAYRYEHRMDAAALYQGSSERIYFGISLATSKFFHDSEDLNGPDGTVFVDYSHRLPGHDHEFRAHADTTYRWSETPDSERLTERFRLQYRSHVVSVIYGSISGTYRRDEFPRSETALLEKRIDNRLDGELSFDAQVRKHLFINWGYLYESQQSTRKVQEYSRHQIGAGFTLTF